MYNIGMTVLRYEFANNYKSLSEMMQATFDTGCESVAYTLDSFQDEESGDMVALIGVAPLHDFMDEVEAIATSADTTDIDAMLEAQKQAFKKIVIPREKFEMMKEYGYLAHIEKQMRDGKFGL